MQRSGKPRPKVIGIDEISIRKGHEYRIVVSDLEKRIPVWFGGKDRSEESVDEFYAEIGEKQGRKIRLAVMDMWKPFEKSVKLVERHWDGIAAYSRPSNKVALGFVEGLNNKIRVLQRRALNHDILNTR